MSVGDRAGWRRAQRKPGGLPREPPHPAHSTTSSNGFIERMNRRLLDECLRVAGRTTSYGRIDQIQAKLDRFLAYYNLDRDHQGYRLRGKITAHDCARLWASLSSIADLL